MTLRQEIEAIENNVLYAKDRVDRICEAIGKTAEGKEPIKKGFDYTGSYQDGFIAGRRFERGEDQAHWQKEIGK